MKIFYRLINILLVTFAVNASPLLWQCGAKPMIWIAAYFFITAYLILFNVFPVLGKYPAFRLRVLDGGAELLLVFFISCCLSIPVMVWAVMELLAGRFEIFGFIVYCVLLVLSEAVIFWNGMIRVYCTSVQLGIRLRVLGVVLGLVPIANLVMLLIIYRKVKSESRFEIYRAELDNKRAEQKICATKYPILLVHGVFFRDSKLLNYWGRIPAALQKNGAVIYYGEQQSAASVENTAKELARRIESIVTETGCEKLNIIAHSKGGLDSRYAISLLGSAKYVASLTTINTPHRGCIFAEHLLGAAGDKLTNTVSGTYNFAFGKLGDPDPDFLAAVGDLTNTSCARLNEIAPNAEGVYYQSVGSVAKNSRGGRFPINISYPIVKKYDGDNDGLVALDSAKWGESFTPLYPKGRRGITHADMIDLNREDIKGFDVREFYIQLVAGLKDMGF